MGYEVSEVPRPLFGPLPREGCHNVQGRVLLRDPNVCVAQLRFEPDGSIDEHAAPFDIDVICLEGCGLTAIDGEVQPLHADQTVRWPAHKPHRLFTAASTMLTLMVEHVGGRRDPPR